MGCCVSREGVAIQGKDISGTDDATNATLNKMRAEHKQVEDMVAKVISEGKPWTDKDFPPEAKSLYDPNVDKGDASQFNLKWKRISEVYKTPQVFSGGIEPNDINQGALGDCYFLAVLSSLAEFPDRIQNMFLTKTIN